MRALTQFSAIAVGGLIALGCNAPPDERPLLICHNSNCVEPPAPEDDDTLGALEASLALEDATGLPLLDGVEVDTFWHGERGICLFAHDLASGIEQPAAAAGEALLEHFRRRRAANKPLTHQRGPFTLFVELKGSVGLSKADKHSEEQRGQHAACAADLLWQLAEPAESEAFDIDLTFTSFDGALLLAVRQELDARGWSDSERVTVSLGAIYSAAQPLDSATQPLDAFDEAAGVSMVTAHPHWLRDTDRQAFASLEWELGLWMFINDEAIHGIRPCRVVGEEDIWYTQSKDGKSVYVFLTEFTGKNRWRKGDRKEIVLKELRSTPQTAISVLGQNDKVLEYNPGADVQSRFKQTDDGLEISVMRAQRIYNNNSWPNTVVVKLQNVEGPE
jgi:hypothetical protein